MNASFPIALIATAFFSALFIDASTDIATWVHCAFFENYCDPTTKNYRDAAYVGLACGSMFAVIAVFFSVREREKSRQEAIGLNLTVLAAGLVSLLKIAVDPDRHHPVYANMDVALVFYLVAFALLILPLLLKDTATFLVLARAALAIVLALVVSPIAFEFLMPLVAGFLEGQADGSTYVLKPYAVLVTSAGFAVLATAAWHVEGRALVPEGFIFVVLCVATLLAAFFGTLPELSEESRGNRMIGAWIAIWHLALPLALTTFMLMFRSFGVRFFLSLLSGLALGRLTYVLTNEMSSTAQIQISSLRVAFDLTFSVPLAVLCGSLAIRLIRPRKHRQTSEV